MTELKGLFFCIGECRWVFNKLWRLAAICNFPSFCDGKGVEKIEKICFLQKNWVDTKIPSSNKLLRHLWRQCLCTQVFLFFLNLHLPFTPRVSTVTLVIEGKSLRWLNGTFHSPLQKHYAFTATVSHQHRQSPKKRLKIFCIVTRITCG